MRTPKTNALMLRWSLKEGARNSTCSEEAHEIYALAEYLEERLAALEADARRYRWLREKPDRLYNDNALRWTSEEMDAAIDAALSQEPGGK